MFQIHLNNSTTLEQPVESSKQDILQEGSRTQATMASGHSPGIFSNAITKEALEPSRGPAYIPRNSHKIPSPHTAITSLYQTQDVHHTSKARKIHSQGKQIMGEGEKFEVAYSPNMDCPNLYSGEDFSSEPQVPKLTKYDGEGCPHTFMDIL